MWYRQGAAAPIQSLAWEHPYALGTAIKKKKTEAGIWKAVVILVTSNFEQMYVKVNEYHNRKDKLP